MMQAFLRRAWRGCTGACALASALSMMAGALSIAAGCQTLNEPIYIAAPAAIEAGGMDDTGMPLPTTVKGTVVLRFRRPTATEQRSINDQSQRLMLDVPWLRRDRIHLELLYTIQNLDPKDEGTFRVSVDGASEFVKYDEGAIAQAFADANEMTQPLALMAPTPRTLGPGQIYQGTLREDDFLEGSLDLDALGRWNAPFAAVLINRSDVNPVGLDGVPANVIIPAMQEIDVTLSAERRMRCDFLVRVRSDDDQLLHESGDNNLFVPTPVVFTPPILPP